ncbi:hypothetical protein CNY89_02670 [Amaricoccus sp. HAR-UPW-R2A-40]|nr:hypothetical protein CNY89_02670 [Amaricoccus sp. HAR-UPW-R2A-40]
MIRREVIIGDCRLLLGDAREILPTLQVDHIITAPPFSERTHTGHDGGAMRGRDGSARAQLGYGALSEADAQDLAALFAAASSGWVCWFTDHTLAPVVQAALAAEGRYVFAPLPFYQPGRSVRLTGDGPCSWTDWIICARTKALNKWGTLPGGYVAGQGWKDKERMGGKPLPLMRLVVGDYSRVGDLVCDPCMGGGTTLVACAHMGRRGIGIEIDEATFDRACKRTRDAYAQPDMFVAPPVAPKQEAMEL